jgi:uncharacterized protein (DUF2461 family)
MLMSSFHSNRRYSGYTVTSGSVMTRHCTRYSPTMSSIDYRTTFQRLGRERVVKVHMPHITSTSSREITPLSRTTNQLSIFVSQLTGTSGGKWHPDAGHLARIRHSIHRRPDKFKKPLLKARFKKLFGGVDGLLTADNRLKTAPKV